MNGQTGRAAAGTLVARSRRPAHATVATAVLRLIGGTDLASASGPVASAGAPVPGAPVSALPAALARPGLPHGHAVGAPVLAVAPADAAATGLPSPAGVPAPAWQDGRPRPRGPADAAGASRPDMRAAAAVLPEAQAAEPPAAPPPGSAGAAPAEQPPGRDAEHDAPVAVPAILDRLSGLAPPTPSRVMASPLVDRARRPAPLAMAPDRAERSAASPANGLVRVTPTAPEPPPATPAPSASPRVVPAHPPVTIGEIHVHVAEPAPPGADPLALLAPYTRGLTARRDGPR